MQHSIWRRILAFVTVLFLTGSIWTTQSPSALAYDNPELLPDSPTPVVDLAKSLNSVQEEKLVKEFERFEADTGWKLRVLTQYDRTPGRAVIKFWGLDDKSVLLVADSRGGNILSFSVGDAVYELLPRTFWIELQTRFGNLYFVREQGEDQAILQAMETVENCLIKGGCGVVPGLPREQWILTLITSIIGGIICGFAAQPRQKGQVIAWQWALIFSPLWGILFFAFGLGPVVTRTSDWLPITRNVAGFLIGALVAYLSPVFSRSFSFRNVIAMEWHVTDAQSLAIIDHEMGEHVFSPAEYEIVRRVVYATADFEYKSLIRFSERALQSAAAALAARTTIMVDVPMIQVGILQDIQNTFANSVYCSMDTPTRPQKENTSVASGMETLAKRYPEGIFVVGQAQTALITLVDLIESEEIRPALIVATPAGFLNVNAARERLQDSLVPNITIDSRKGNAVVAAAIVDGLVDLAWQAYGKV